MPYNVELSAGSFIAHGPRPPYAALRKLSRKPTTRISKQMAQLEDLEHPVKVLDFGSAEASILEDVEKMRAEAQLLADGIGILGYHVRDDAVTCRIRRS